MSRRFVAPTMRTNPIEPDRTTLLNPDASVKRPSKVLTAYRDEVLRIARMHHCADVRVFGSIAHGRDTVSSDVDLLVLFDEDANLFDLINMQDELAELFHLRVDVISEAALHGRGLRTAAEAVPL